MPNSPQPPPPHPPVVLRADQPAYQPGPPRKPEQAREGGWGSGRGVMPHVVPTEAVACPSEPEKEIKPRETSGQKGCIVKLAKRPGANRPSARRAKALDGGGLTIGGRGATPPSAIASPLNRAAGPARGPHWGSSANPILTQPGRIPTNQLRYTKTTKHDSAVACVPQNIQPAWKCTGTSHTFLLFATL